MTEINGIEYPDELLKMVQPGKKVHVYWGPSRIRVTWHIRAIVDEDRVVYRYWSKRRWHYVTESLYRFLLKYNNGSLERA